VTRTSRFARVLGAALTLVLAESFLPAVRAGAVAPEPLQALRKQADQLERLSLWERACDVYEDILRLDRDQPGIRARYRFCLRRAYQVRRFQDPSYCKEVLSLKYPEALDLYSVVVRRLLSNSLDREHVSPADVFRKGLEELRFALADATFCKDFLPGVPAETIHAFRARLSRWEVPPQLTRQQVKDQVREVAMAALQTLNLSATTTVLEFTCGACYAFDEYTAYLTPSQLQELYESIKGQYVGVGVRLVLQDNHLTISEVLPDSPAGEIMPPLRQDDQVAPSGFFEEQGVGRPGLAHGLATNLKVLATPLEFLQD